MTLNVKLYDAYDIFLYKIFIENTFDDSLSGLTAKNEKDTLLDFMSNLSRCQCCSYFHLTCCTKNHLQSF